MLKAVIKQITGFHFDAGCILFMKLSHSEKKNTPMKAVYISMDSTLRGNTLHRENCWTSVPGEHREKWQIAFYKAVTQLTVATVWCATAVLTQEPCHNQSASQRTMKEFKMLNLTKHTVKIY